MYLLMRQYLCQKRFGTVVLRIIKESVRGILFDDLPLIHENHPIRHRFGKTHFVRNTQHGNALLG